LTLPRFVFQRLNRAVVAVRKNDRGKKTRFPRARSPGVVKRRRGKRYAANTRGPKLTANDVIRPVAITYAVRDHDNACRFILRNVRRKSGVGAKKLTVAALQRHVITIIAVSIRNLFLRYTFRSYGCRRISLTSRRDKQRSRCIYLFLFSKPAVRRDRNREQFELYVKRRISIRIERSDRFVHSHIELVKIDIFVLNIILFSCTEKN